MNRLAHETSPYLLQHQHNPVDWFPWGEEALTLAKAQDKPILLSVGYSACHWCHVMERECFENPHIAALMNAAFVNIKVDREERPDVDAIYMDAVQMLTGQGGWPMTVFMTPDGRPFFAGTYFPPEDVYGRPGFPRVIEAVTVAWKTNRIEIEQQSAEILDNLKQSSNLGENNEHLLLTPALLDRAFAKMSAGFDAAYGGFGSAPKFPQPANLDFLLRYHVVSKRQEPLAMVEKTLQKMALGGIYDQLGGGFHRYSTDQTWLVPHFEKMLYDNAQLAVTYAHAFQATGKSFYKGVAEETLEYILREMTGPEGGFYSAQDADSEGEEGKFFVWTPAEVAAVLGEHEAQVFASFYDISAVGNWEGVNILHVVRDAQDVADGFGLTLQQAADILDGGRIKLLAAREHRVKPGLDDKILTAWNGLMLAAFAECGAIFGRQDFINAAEKNAEFLIDALTVKAADSRLQRSQLLRTWRSGTAKLNGYLEDYAFLADGLLHLYAATGKIRWLLEASALAQTMLDYFRDPLGEGFFATSRDHETLIHRPKDWDDNATPSGNSVAVEVLLKLAILRDNPEWKETAAKVLRSLAPVMEQHPYSFARLLCALDFYLSTPKEIVLIGEMQEETVQEFLAAIYEKYLPNKILALGGHSDAYEKIVPLFAGKTLIEGEAAAYICENYACRQPVTTADALREQLHAK